MDRVQVVHILRSQVNRLFNQVGESDPFLRFGVDLINSVQRMQNSIQQNRAVLAHFMNDLYQRSRRHPAMRMPVCQRGCFRAEAADIPDILLPVIEVQPNGGYTHHAAAAFAVVDRCLDRSVFTAAQSGKAGISGSPRAVQFGDVAEPCVAGMYIRRVPALLCLQPVPVAKTDIMRIGTSDAPRHTPGHPKQEAVGGEQRHLRIIGDLRHATCQIVFSDAAFAVSAEDLPFAEKLDGIPQSVSGSAADKASPKPVLIPHSVTSSKTVQSLDLLHFQYSIEHRVYPVRNH